MIMVNEVFAATTVVNINALITMPTKLFDGLLAPTTVRKNADIVRTLQM